MAMGHGVPDGSMIKLPSGYWNVKTPDGWKLVHRVVMEKHIGRPLEPEERVHFVNKDADKKNPTPEDLEIRIVRKKTMRAKQRRVEQLRAELHSLLKELDDEPV